MILETISNIHVQNHPQQFISNLLESWNNSGTVWGAAPFHLITNIQYVTGKMDFKVVHSAVTVSKFSDPTADSGRARV